MSSVNKKKKFKNTYCIGSFFKDKTLRLKRRMFFTASQHKKLKFKIWEVGQSIVE